MPERVSGGKVNRPSSRHVALQCLVRIERDGAFANLVLGPILERSGLDKESRAFVTMLVYGTTRMKRACDALVDRFVLKEPDIVTRQILRLGAFQIAFTDVAVHAAVGETVAIASHRSKGFVNAILRKVAAHPMTSPESWPNDATRLSYPDWILDRLSTEMDRGELVSALEAMNRPAPVSVRDDGYVQDLSSQDVVRAVGARSGEIVVDLCAGPGGKATGLASTGAQVVALDLNPTRAGLVRTNAQSTRHPLSVAVADARRIPMADATADRVLVDAPCSGLGVLRRRADARWRITPDDLSELAVIQQSILGEAARIVRPGGVLIYSVCTLTAQESIDHGIPPGFEVVEPEGDGDLPALGHEWEKFGIGARILPHRKDSDGMILVRYRRSA